MKLTITRIFLSLSGIKWLGAITPLGGIAFIIGWGCLAIAAWNYK